MVTGIVLVNVERNMITKVINGLQKIPGVSEVYSVAGEYDLVVMIRVSNNPELADIVATKMTHDIEGIIHTKTLVTNNLYTQVGFILLFGVACKTAILIVEFAKESQQRDNMSIVEAAEHAAKLRFRAVLMTAVSFILGVMPLVLATGAGAASRVSLGTAVFGGMLVAAIGGTLLIPCFYVVVQRLIEWRKK